MVAYDGLMVYGSLRWLMMAYGGLRWLMMAYGGLRWLMMAYGGLRWLMMAYGGLWWMFNELEIHFRNLAIMKFIVSHQSHFKNIKWPSLLIARPCFLFKAL